MLYSEGLKERLYSKVEVDTSTECWNWSASKNDAGYGKIRLDAPSRRVVRAHRLSLAVNDNIELPKDKQALHKCDNPACINPDHLFWGTHTDNMRDMAAKGRAATQHRNQTGSKNYRATVTESDIVVILQRIKNGENNKAIAKDYPMTHSAVSLIRRGKTWKNVPRP